MEKLQRILKLERSQNSWQLKRNERSRKERVDTIPPTMKLDTIQHMCVAPQYSQLSDKRRNLAHHDQVLIRLIVIVIVVLPYTAGNRGAADDQIDTSSH